ncbi:MAG: YraN family protein [Candidatus Falkowbacteria bacterium]|nr:YraN family protein [Candidatus Falkowbacteria bacterium]
MPGHNKIVGAYGESLAKNYLIKNGYNIIENNVKISFKEIDIIAEKDQVLIFVEVKTRTSLLFGLADDAISQQKIQTLKKAISLYFNRVNNIIYHKDIRLDFISIDINKDQKTAHIKHFKDIA